jgi:hypothetical protein
MALLYRADLTPSKLDLLSAWLPTRPWYSGSATPSLRREASYRFDDPAGEVGVEIMLVRGDDGPLFQTPLTYRGAPLGGAEEWLLGTSEHSVLGPRWIYDGCGDPVYASVLADAIVGRAGQAEEFVDIDGRLEKREPAMAVRGSGATVDAPVADALVRVEEGDPTVIVTAGLELRVVRVLSDDRAVEGLSLTGTWGGRSTPVLLAEARLG